MNPKRGAFLLTLEMAEKIFSVPIEEREALLLKMAQEHKAEFLGVTDKGAPELATELVKAGIRAKSYIKGTGKKETKNPLTITPKSDTLLQETEKQYNKTPPA